MKAGRSALMVSASVVPFLDFSGVPPRGRVLDAGCGTGSLTLALAAHPDLVAIEALDFEDNFVAALCKRTTDPRIRAQQGDVCALPYRDEEFDGVYSLLVLHFVSDPHRAVREMRRVLRPGATAAATVWDTYGGMPSWRLFWDTILALEPEAAGKRASPRRPMTGEGELRAAFEGAGLRESSTRCSRSVWTAPISTISGTQWSTDREPSGTSL